jgi:hypothetical protein
LSGVEWRRITLRCACPPHLGPELAQDIQAAFHQSYPHEFDVACQYQNGALLLSSTSDYDPKGLNLGDEFSDLISAYCAESFDGEIELVCSVRCPAPANRN